MHSHGLSLSLPSNIDQGNNLSFSNEQKNLALILPQPPFANLIVQLVIRHLLPEIPTCSVPTPPRLLSLFQPLSQMHSHSLTFSLPPALPFSRRTFPPLTVSQGDIVVEREVSLREVVTSG